VVEPLNLQTARWQYEKNKLGHCKKIPSVEQIVTLLAKKLLTML
jgi:hypothetical protein